MPFSSPLSWFAIITLLLDIVSAGASSGCGTALPSNQKAGGNSIATGLKTDDGTQRTYRIYIPKLYTSTTPASLIINYHGRGSTGKQQEQITGMSDPNWNNASIVLYPDGLNAEWQGDPDVNGVDDLKFTQNLVTAVSSQYCVDPSRVYAVGASNGGAFVGNFLACSTWGLANIAVFGAAYGAFYTNTSDKACGPTSNGKTRFTPLDVPISCNSTKADVPMIEFHGTGDQTIPYDGGDRRGLCLPAIPHWVTDWAGRTGLGTSNSSKSIFSDKAVKYEFGTDAKLGQVTHYEIVGMGHTWPTTNGNTAPLDATPILLDFFRKWGPGDGKAPAGVGGTTTTASNAASTSGSSAKKSAAISLHHSAGFVHESVSLFVMTLIFLMFA